MRPALLISIFVAAALIIGGAALFKRNLRPPAPRPGSEEVSSVEPATSSESAGTSNSLALPVAKTADTDQAGSRSVAPTPAENHEEYVKKRSAELQDLGMENDSASLNTILSELNNRDPEIRHAALEATIQFGSRDAIPTLVDAAAQTDDPKEKQAFLDATEFLKLPSLTEVMAKGGAKPGAQPVVNGLRPAMPPRK